MAEAPVTASHAGKGGVEWGEVQRLLLRGYVKLPWAHFLLLRVTDSSKAAGFLRQVLEDGFVRFGWGHRHDTEPSGALAFTSDGLRAMGLEDDTIRGFSPEFCQGLDYRDRPRILRDVDGSAPSGWLWGSEGNRVHVLLATYAESEEALARSLRQKRDQLRSAGLVELAGPGGEELGASRPLDFMKDSFNGPKRPEHFGFADGIAQPRFRDEPAGVRSARTREDDRVAPGELLLGYPNEVGLFARSPRLCPADAGRAHFSRPDHDFGKNGSYLVFRQLEQDVPAFWTLLGKGVSAPEPDEKIRIASKMVGRWPNGKPLADGRTVDGHGYDPEDFDFARDDRDGLRCPVGAHIRRANPRSTLSRDPVAGAAKSKKHRILRRGRPYGLPFVEPLVPQEILRALDDGGGNPGPRGLHFLCFNADIANQFEFIQQSWINGPMFQGLHGEVDPVAGDPAAGRGCFSIPGDPLRERVPAAARCIQTRGGAYFFAPSQAALHYLGRCTNGGPGK